MNRKVLKAMENVGKADALMFAFEQAYLEIPNDADKREIANRAEHAFYALWDVIEAARKDLESLTMEAGLD